MCWPPISARRSIRYCFTVVIRLSRTLLPLPRFAPVGPMVRPRCGSERGLLFRWDNCRQAKFRLEEVVSSLQRAFDPPLLARPRLSADVDGRARGGPQYASRHLPGVHADFPEVPPAL